MLKTHNSDRHGEARAILKRNTENLNARDGLESPHCCYRTPEMVNIPKEELKQIDDYYCC